MISVRLCVLPLVFTAGLHRPPDSAFSLDVRVCTRKVVKPGVSLFEFTAACGSKKLRLWLWNICIFTIPVPRL